MATGNRARLWPVALATVTAILTGCATSGVKVSCEGKLQPINMAAAKSVARADTPGSKSPGVAP